MAAVVIQSPMSPLEHWKELAEQEREHKAQVIARAAQPAPVVPEGYVLVPIKPTIEMVEAGYEEGIGKPDRSGHARIIEQYDAMLAAAPSQDVAGLVEAAKKADDALSALVRNDQPLETLARKYGSDWSSAIDKVRTELVIQIAAHDKQSGGEV